MNLNLRHYQVDAKAGVFKQWESVQSTLVVLPTGCGKTALAAAIIAQCLPERSLFLAHREELIWQAKEKLEKFCNIESEVEMGDYWACVNGLFRPPVMLSSVQTQGSAWGGRRRMGRFRPEEFMKVIFDEAHHAPAKSWMDLKNYYQQNPKAKFLGLTATPDRADEEALGKVFDTVAFDYEIVQAIKDGWLVNIDQQFIHLRELDFSECRTTAGDLNGADLAAVMEQEKNLLGVASGVLQVAGDRRTLVFTASVAQAERLAQIFNRHRPGSANWVCGKTNKETRRAMVKDFSQNKFQYMVNCGVFTEGYDDWGVSCIAMARATKSRSLYAQMAGRGTRPVDGCVDPLPTAEARREAIRSSVKPSCLILDFVGNSGRHKLMTAVNILGTACTEEALARAVKIAQKKGGPVDVVELAEQAEEELKEETRLKRLEEEAKRLKLIAKVKFSTKQINPFDAWDIDPVERGFDKSKTLSLAQRNMLMRQGIDPDTMNYSEGTALCREMLRRWRHGLCTIKQAGFLKQHGFDTKNMTMIEASRHISRLKNHSEAKPKLPVTSPHQKMLGQEESPFND